ncbi:hypothetical protein, partial [Nonomuraea sp. NPDC049784]|uniref:hypothetical protein n=1 Tax=Nonomuraea sp. NPDC049784 TaxID=3154361 RepID=UPI0033DA7088
RPLRDGQITPTHTKIVSEVDHPGDPLLKQALEGTVTVLTALTGSALAISPETIRSATTCDQRAPSRPT